MKAILDFLKKLVGINTEKPKEKTIDPVVNETISEQSTDPIVTPTIEVEVAQKNNFCFPRCIRNRK